LGEGLVVCSSETIVAYWVEVLAAKASASGNSNDVASRN
jgi:hypothetical protein